MTARPNKSWPGIKRALEFAQLSLAMPPGEYLSSISSPGARAGILRKSKYIERVTPGSHLIARFVLPLPYCPTLNKLTRSHFSLKTSSGKKVFKMMYEQNRFSRGELLSGRPLVRFVRFSMKETDPADAGWTKVPLDVLVNREGSFHDQHHMRFLADDSNESARTKFWWEPGNLKHQLVYCDIWQ